ncbi:MAG: poly-gamma-glutamate biosynthesis protein PgsC [Acidobacteriota bacterium]
MVEVAITLGLVLSLLAYEGFGLAAGGLVVPGYIALQLGSPERLAGVFVVAMLTWAVIKLIARYTFVFGRRQLVLCVLVGCLLSIASRNFLSFEIGLATVELAAVGWVIPGLIANWFLKQGIARTLGAITVTSILVRLTLIVVFGGALLPS